MENATQALLIIAGVLIGVIILSMAVYLTYTMGEYASDTQSKITENQVTQFNDKFLRYAGLNDLTIQDIITVKNYALENNNKDANYNPALSKYRAGDYNDYIDVYYNDRKAQAYQESALTIMNMSDEDILKAEINKQNDSNNPKSYNRFTCEVKINSNTGKVNKIYFYEAT